jgi:hypothetical protein
MPTNPANAKRATQPATALEVKAEAKPSAKAASALGARRAVESSVP